MNKMIVTLLSFSSLVFAQDAFIELKVGGGNIDYNIPTAEAGDSSGDVVFDYDTQVSDYRWAEFEHALPLIPNIRVESSLMDFSGRATGTGNFNGFPISANSASTLDLKNKDLMAYWAIPFIDIVSIADADFGLGVKKFDGLLVIKNITEEAIDALAPYAFLRIGVHDEAGGLGGEGLLKYATDGVSTFYEYMIKVEYTVNLPLAGADINIGIEGGYRSMLLDSQSATSADYAYLKFKGTFVGLVAKFGI